MADISSIAKQPTITLRGGDFVLGFEPPAKIATENCGLRITCHDHDKVSVACDIQHGLDGKLDFAVAIPSLRIPWLVKVELVLGEDLVDISGLFLRYQLDKEKLEDNVYMTNHLFNASARHYSNDDLLIVAYAYLQMLPLHNPNFGGLITILSYRIAEKPQERAGLLDVVYTTYRHYLDKVSSHNAVAFRWLVSCSSALTTVLLAVGSINQAANVVDGSLKVIIHPGFNPMGHQNYALLLFQGGLIKAWYGQFDEATRLFISAVNAGRYGMIDLLHPQNNWVLGQLSDCHKFLHIVEAAYNAALACSRNKLPPESRFAAAKAGPKIQINFHTLFERFECCKTATPPFFEQVLQKMQTHLSPM